MCDISFGFISSSRTSSDKICSEFFFLFKSMLGEMIRWWRCNSCSRKAGKDLKSNISGFIKDFFDFESVDKFYGADKLGRICVKEVLS